MVQAHYFSNKVEENKFDSKKLWQQLKKLGYKNKTNESSKVVLKIDKETFNYPKTVTDHFNTFFLQI